ncbi:MAG: hypothetical protein M1133_04095, partial [Armatimonadetes bacterium]|nr:hypothetical protein [Armatimonadota bacterium]
MAIRLFVGANCALAAEAPVIAPPPTLSATDASVTGGTGTTAPLPGQPMTEPQIPIPSNSIPSPIAPSMPPTGLTPATPAPVPEKLGDFIEVSADQVRTTFDENDRALLTLAEGHVIARYKDLIITADRGQVDHQTNIAELTGNVIFKIGIEEVHGGRVTLNLKTGKWSVETAKTTISPEFAKGYLKAPVYAHGLLIEGVKRKSIVGYSAETTTCNLENPHYELVARSVAVYPDNKIVLRDVTAFALGHKLLTLRRLPIPLRQIHRNPQLIPRFGQSAEEGAYVKLSYPYMGNESTSGFFLLDLMQRKGIREGIRHTYQVRNGAGDIQFFHLFDRNISQDTISGHGDIRQQFGTIRASLISDLRANSYLYAPQSKSLNTQLTLSRSRLDANTSLVVNQAINDSVSRTTTLSGSLAHRQLFADRIAMNNNFDYTSFNTGAQTTARLTSQTAFARSENKFDWTLSAQKLTDLSDEAFVGGGRFAGIERLPELALVSDSARLGKTLPFGLPALVKFSFGQYNELPANTNLARTYLELDTPVRKHNVTDSWSFAAGGGFRQFAYSDNTAQYSVDTSAELSKKLGPNSAFGLTYRLQQPKGFSPFRFDFITKYNIVNASLNVRDTEKFKLSLLTGYNFEQKQFPWQDATLRFSIQPTSSFMLYTATGYDFNRSRWRTLINQVRIRAGEDFKLDFGTRFDTTRSKLADVRTQMDTKVGSKTRLQALAGYNGLTGNFDY